MTAAPPNARNVRDDFDGTSADAGATHRWAMRQTWARLLFVHGRADPAAVARLLPRDLELDLYEGEAWVGVVPFTLLGGRLRGLPPLPGTVDFHETNVRTYVRHHGIRGVWFFSLDAARLLPVIGARVGVRLPYFHSRMHVEECGADVRYRSVRRRGGARLVATWRRGEPLPPAAPGTLEHFLYERYCLYHVMGRRLCRMRVAHEPWPRHRAELLEWDDTLVPAAGLPPLAPPLLVEGAGPVHAHIAPPEFVARLET